MNTTALLVIDVQNSFFHRDYWVDDGFDTYRKQQIRLIEIARDRQWHIAHILHNEMQGPFSPESGYVRSMDFIDRQAHDPVFNKYIHNALTHSGLHEWLQQQEVSTLIISGLRTEQCCETTARVGSDLGYHIEFVLDATHTFPMIHPLSGENISAGSIKSHTALVLSQRFATLRTVSDYESTV